MGRKSVAGLWRSHSRRIATVNAVVESFFGTLKSELIYW